MDRQSDVHNNREGTICPICHGKQDPAFVEWVTLAFEGVRHTLTPDETKAWLAQMKENHLRG
jgi:hypothetical protein